MIELRHNVKSKLTFAVAFAFLFCALFFSALFAFFAKDAHANGNVSADEPVPPANKSVRRAPIRRPPPKTPKAPEVSVEVVNEPAAQKPESAESAQAQPELYQTGSLEMGIQMMEQGRYKQAHDLLQMAVQEDQGNPYAWYWYGMAHEKVGQYESAQLFYARAVELDPAFPPFSRVLAYPDDGDRKALWDPLRPARVYPIELGDQDIAIVPPDAPDATFRQPVPGADPVLPQVPVYVPPDIPSIAGDSVQQPVYEPAEPAEQIQTASFDFPPPEHIGEAPVYIPPPPPR